ncbi:MAG: hypothetical protein CMH41_04470 [Micrococcales bacterium]|nr:hypothetical protein [Micrococcales bacterium]
MYFWLMMLTAGVLITSGAIIAFREPPIRGDSSRSLGIGTVLVGVCVLLAFAVGSPVALALAIICSGIALVVFGRSLLHRQQVQPLQHR